MTERRRIDTPWAETYIGLEGKVEVLVGRSWRRMDPGTVIAIPPFAVHTYRVTSAQARFIAVTMTAKAGRFFADMSASLPPGAFTPDPLPTLLQVTGRHELEIVQPAGAR